MKVKGITFIKIFLVAVLVTSTIFSGCKNIFEEKNSDSNNEFGYIVLNNSEIKALNQSEITKAVVTVSGSDFETITKDNVSVSNGAGSTVIDNIPTGFNRLISVQAYNNSTEIKNITLRAVADIKTGENNITVKWDTTALGNVYNELLFLGVKISSLTETQENKILGAIPSVENPLLVDAGEIANDYNNDSLKDSSNYILSTGSVKITSYGLSGSSFIVTDPYSVKSSSVSSDGDVITISNVIPGTWNIYSINNNSYTFQKSVTVTSSEIKDIQIGEQDPLEGKLFIFIKASSAPTIWAWESNSGLALSAGLGETWPGTTMTAATSIYMDTPSGWYMKDFTSAGSLKGTGTILFKLNGSDPELNSGKTSTFWYDGTSFYAVDPTEPAVPVAPSVTISPSSGDVYETSSIEITITDGNGSISSMSGSINGKSITLSEGNNSFDVSSYASVGDSFTVTVSATNEIGTTSKTSGTLNVVETSLVNMPTEWNELRIYQVMVSSFQDGDSSIGFTTAYGPSGALTGGDLQGVINSLDYVKSLGMNAIWMTPIFQSAGSGQLDSTGYFCSDYFNVDNRFGTNQKLAELIEKAHNKGIAIILDGVFGHHGGSVASSPNGNNVSGKNPVNYPASLDFYNEVAAYWIKNYKIDGWRFDQCYQVGLGENGNGDGDNCATGGHNYWYDIRKTIESAASSNGTFGKEWGTLGYTVGEHWKGDASLIQKGSINPGSAAGYGLRSCFDFPARYRLVNALAKAESDAGGESLGSAISYTYKDYSTKGYTHSEGYYPNVFITNHDLVRFGNLIHWMYGDSNSGDRYWGLHRVAIATQAAYSGPITIYYGDEWGAYVDGYNSNGDLGAYNDNASRSTGKISGFTTDEQALVTFSSKLMALRAKYPALWKGSATDLKTETNYYVGKKTLSGEKSIGIIINKGSSFVSYSFSGEDLIDGGTYSGSCPAYSAKFVLLNE